MSVRLRLVRDGATPSPRGHVTAGSFTRVPRIFGTYSPRTGVWSQYTVKEKETGKETRLRMAIVGKEDDAFWYEVTVEDGPVRNTIKMLVKGDPNDPESLTRFIIRSGNEPAREMPRDFVAVGRRMAVHMFESHSGVSAYDQSGIRLKDIGQRKASVPAGFFKVVRKKIVDSGGRELAVYDFEPTVLPFGVVTSDTDKARWS